MVSRRCLGQPVALRYIRLLHAPGSSGGLSFSSCCILLCSRRRRQGANWLAVKRHRTHRLLGRTTEDRRQRLTVLLSMHRASGMSNLTHFLQEESKSRDQASQPRLGVKGDNELQQEILSPTLHLSFSRRRSLASFAARRQTCPLKSVSARCACLAGWVHSFIYGLGVCSYLVSHGNRRYICIYVTHTRAHWYLSIHVFSL